MKPVDEKCYNEGMAAFAKGKTLRSMFDQMIAKQNAPNRDWQKEESEFNSMMLGFADAFLAKIRSR